MGLCHRQQSQQLRSTLSAQVTRKDVTDFAHGRMVFRFWPFRQKTAKAKRKLRFPPSTSHNNLSKPHDSPSTISGVQRYFGRKRDYCYINSIWMPERPSVSKKLLHLRLPGKATLPDKGEGEKNLIDCRNACDLLIYYNCSSAHDKFPALGAGSRSVSAVSCVGTWTDCRASNDFQMLTNSNSIFRIKKKNP